MKNINKKNILIILPTYHGGGAEKVLLNYFENNKSFKNNLFLFIVNAKELQRKSFNNNRIELSFNKFIKAVPKLLVTIKEKKIDAVFSTFPHTSTVILALKFLKVHNAKIIIRQPNMIENSLSRSFKFSTSFG